MSKLALLLAIACPLTDEPRWLQIDNEWMVVVRDCAGNQPGLALTDCLVVERNPRR